MHILIKSPAAPAFHRPRPRRGGGCTPRARGEQGRGLQALQQTDPTALRCASCGDEGPPRGSSRDRCPPQRIFIFLPRPQLRAGLSPNFFLALLRPPAGSGLQADCPNLQMNPTAVTVRTLLCPPPSKVSPNHYARATATNPISVVGSHLTQPSWLASSAGQLSGKRASSGRFCRGRHWRRDDPPVPTPGTHH